MRYSLLCAICCRSSAWVPDSPTRRYLLKREDGCAVAATAGRASRLHHARRCDGSSEGAVLRHTNPRRGSAPNGCAPSGSSLRHTHRRDSSSGSQLQPCSMRGSGTLCSSRLHRARRRDRSSGSRPQPCGTRGGGTPSASRLHRASRRDSSPRGGDTPCGGRLPRTHRRNSSGGSRPQPCGTQASNQTCNAAVGSTHAARAM